MHGKVEDKEQITTKQNKWENERGTYKHCPRRRAEREESQNSHAQHGFKLMNVESNSYSSPLKTQNNRGTKALAGQTANQV